MKFKVDAAILKKLSRVFQPGDYPIAFTSYPGDHDYVSISAYDGFKYGNAQFDADVYDGGEVIFSGSYLFKLSRLEGDVTVQRIADNKLLFKDKVRPIEVPLMPIATGPYLMPKRIDLGSIALGLKEFKNIIKQVRFATADDQNRLEGRFDCILLKFGGDYIQAVGAHWRVFAISKIQQGSPYKGEFKLPKRALDFIQCLEGDMAHLAFHPGGVSLSVSGHIMLDIYIPSHTAPFPQYESALNVPVNTVLKMQQEELTDILLDMKMMSDMVTVRCGHEGYIKYFARFRSRDGNGAAIERSCKEDSWSGDDIKICVNRKTLFDAIENVSGEVTFGFSNGMGNFTVTAEGGNFHAVLTSFSDAEKK